MEETRGRKDGAAWIGWAVPAVKLLPVKEEGVTRLRPHRPAWRAQTYGTQSCLAMTRVISMHLAFTAVMMDSEMPPIEGGGDPRMPFQSCSE